MNRTTIRCSTVRVLCTCGEAIDLRVVHPDFGDAPELWTCSTCGALFALTPELKAHSGIHPDRLKSAVDCPVCGESLAEAMPYPENHVCPRCRRHGRVILDDRRIPSDEEMTTCECWNPYEP